MAHKLILAILTLSTALGAADGTEWKTVPQASGTYYHDNVDGLYYKDSVNKGASASCTVTLDDQKKVRQTNIELTITYRSRGIQRFKYSQIALVASDVQDVYLDGCDLVEGLGVSKIQRH